MPEEYRSQPPRRRRRRRRKKWSAKRWRFELTRIGLLLVLIALIVGLFQGCRAVIGLLGSPQESAPEAGQAEEQTPDGQEAPPAETVAPQEPEEKEISLVMVGDVLLHTPLQESGQQSDGSYNYDHFFTHTKSLISGADLALVNQEVTLGGAGVGPLRLSRLQRRL